MTEGLRRREWIDKGIVAMLAKAIALSA